jgi:transcriptional regulator with XRE-family HTH domain
MPSSFDQYGTFLRSRRLDGQLSQRDLAKKVGVDFTYLSKVENGHLAPPSENTITLLAKALGDDPKDHLAQARKVPLKLSSIVADYPVEATILLRAIADKPLARKTYMKLLKTVNEAGSTNAPSRALSRGRVSRNTGGRTPKSR